MIFKIKKSYVTAVALLTACALIFGMSGKIIQVSTKHESIALPIVMYHQLTKSDSRAGKYILTVEQFEKDLIFLKNNGYRTLSVSQLLSFAAGKCDIPEKSVMLTFDDGYETFYEYALPILEKYEFNAVVFVVGALADYYTEIDDHNLNYSYLNWSEIKELDENKLIDIQSHSFDLHKNTGNRSGMKKKKGETFEQYSEFLRDDASKMKEKMLNFIGREPTAIAYPFGSYSDESSEILKKCGIKMAFTCEERVNKIKKAESDWLFRLGRYNRHSGISSESFFEKMGIC